MRPDAVQRDLIVLTADKNCQFALRGVLARHAALQIRPLNIDSYVHPEKDPGVLRHCHDFLHPFAPTHRHALVLLDREGSGCEAISRIELELAVEERLNRVGWENLACAVVVDPELDIWVWSDSPHVAKELGWGNRSPELREWLRQKGWLTAHEPKPSHPKEAMEAALRQVRKPRSSAIYRSLAEQVSLSRCTDPAFGKLKATLIRWFGKNQPAAG